MTKYKYSRKDRRKLSIKAKEIKSQFPKESKPGKKLYNPDPMIVMARNYLKSSQAYKHLRYGNAWPKEGILYLEVSKSLINRALKFTNSFILLCKLRGHDIIIRKRKTILIVEGEEYKIRIVEKREKVVDRSGKYEEFHWVPNGKLSLKIDSWDPQEWCDTKTKRLEDQLPKLVAAFEFRAEKDIGDREKWRLERIEELRLWEVEENEKSRIQWKLKKIEILRKDSMKWSEAQSLSNFIHELEKQKNLFKEQEDWIVWAKGIVEYLDPLSNGIGELMDQYELKSAAD